MNGLQLRWWKAACFAVLSGTIAAGSWYGFASAQPLPSSQPKSPSAKAEPVVPWVRAASATRFEPPPEPANKFPAIPIPTTAERVIPAGAKVAVPTVTVPTLPVETQPPTMPPMVVPEFKPVPVPAIPGNIEPLPTPAPVIPMPGTSVPAPAPIVPMPMVPTPAPVVTTPMPMVPRVDEPLKPVIAPPATVAPPAPPLKSADPAKPMLPLPADFNLRPMNVGNSVKPDAPTTPVIPPPMLNPVPSLPLPTSSATAEPVLAVPTSRSKPAELPMAPTEKYVFAVPHDTSIQIPTPGVATMMNNPTVMAALTGIALAFGPDAGARADDPNKPVDVAQLKKDLDEANRKLALAQRDIDQLSLLLYGRKGTDGKLLEYDVGALEEIRRLKEKVKALEGGSTTALRPNIPSVVGKGTVKVVNEYPIPVSIIINEKNYRVESNTTLNVDVPVGDFSYQLLQSGAPATRSTIKEKETVTLRVK